MFSSNYYCLLVTLYVACTTRMINNNAVEAFASSCQRKSLSFQSTTKTIVLSGLVKEDNLILRMSSPQSEEKTESTEVTKPAVPTSGTYYDDEVEPVEKVGISNSMKERLLREASSGLDPEKKNTNVILYIIAAVAVLVILGGQGILY